MQINNQSVNVKIEGHKGTWYTICTEVHEIEDKEVTCHLMEHETYGDGAAHVVVDSDNNIIIENCFNGFDDLVYCLEEGIDPREN